MLPVALSCKLVKKPSGHCMAMITSLLHSRWPLDAHYGTKKLWPIERVDYSVQIIYIRHSSY